MRVILVTGPPSSGKTTHVATNKKPDDLVIDYDALAVALGSPDSHDHPSAIKPFAAAARAAVIRALAIDERQGTAWLIQCDPSPDALAMAHQTITLTECYERPRGTVEHRRSGSLD